MPCLPDVCVGWLMGNTSKRLLEFVWFLVTLQCHTMLDPSEIEWFTSQLKNTLSCGVMYQKILCTCSFSWLCHGSGILCMREDFFSGCCEIWACIRPPFSCYILSTPLRNQRPVHIAQAFLRQHLALFFQVTSKINLKIDQFKMWQMAGLKM